MFSLLNWAILCYFFCHILGYVVLFNRGGCAGGYKELDEEEIEETRRRRREADEVDDLLTFYGDLFSLIFGF